jgi:hypothetical protein
MLAPDPADEDLDRHDAAEFQQQYGQNRAPPGVPRVQQLATGPHLNWTENPKLHRPSCGSVATIDCAGRASHGRVTCR